ncbi:MAG: zinc ribbon domain-containing protein [Chloroflexi bacterium]|nr:zinc ribbon domain-containing protein [Chloroflexota bacterium]
MSTAGSRLIVEQCPQCGGNLPPGGDQIICPYCGSRLIRRHVGTQREAEGSQEAFVQGMHLKLLSCVDTQGIGIEAFRMLIPSGWEFAGGVHWLMNNPGMPAVIAFQVRNPGGAEAFEVFPSLPFYWTNNPMVLMTFPVGSFYFGNEVRPPVGAQQALREIVLPRFRGNMASLQISHEEHLPDLARQLQATRPEAPSALTTADGAKARVRYAKGAETIEEEFFCVVELTRVVTPMLMAAMENIFWQASYLFSFRTLAGRLDDLVDIFQTMAGSFRLNPLWYSRYTQVSQYLIQNQIQQIHNIGQLSRIISQTSNQISDMMMESYYQRQQVYDRISSSFSQAIRGVDEYHDPFKEYGVELPGGYRHAWANSLGEYILTDDPNFNPNIGSNLNWQPMERK